MKKIIAWWTGATSVWSGAIITNWMISIVNIMSLEERGVKYVMEFNPLY